MTVTDLLGADYAIDQTDVSVNYDLNPQAAMKYVGDTVYYNYLGLVRWGGVFGLAEFKKENLSAFLNLTTAMNGYKKIDYFLGTKSDWKYTPGFTVKTGANYNLEPTFKRFCQPGLVVENT